MAVFDQSIRQFLEEAGSKSPTPGGGSIAALAAALGASMGAMVANITVGSKYEAMQDDMKAVVGKMVSAIEQFENILMKDMDCFNSYMTALSMPKRSEQEKAARSYAIQEAAKRAADVPLELMMRCEEIINVLEEVTNQVNKNVISDLGIAVIMLEAAIQSAWITVEINLGSIKNDGLKQKYLEAGAAILKKSAETKQNVLQRVRSRL
ncbi:cyclodeaminase/cyclohydrolase family protein [Paenibacillus alkalitolerans]|uniref:cyclodeaminase/cyclohydrolase family protein n=1 Tax=Paenibacillus alkalitolerans TaxID=2799335 RepID=UPI0018F6117E|nr:cyclodeaminase/cyclohydrolase family protein [Paenibacillus alkalitolerans]